MDKIEHAANNEYFNKLNLLKEVQKKRYLPQS
jgi:hypothetical protein